MLNKNLTTKIPENLDNWNAINYPINEPNHERIYTVSSPMIGIKSKGIYSLASEQDLKNYFENLREGDLQPVLDSKGNVKIVGVGQGKSIKTKIESFGKDSFKRFGEYVFGPIESLKIAIDYLN